MPKAQSKSAAPPALPWWLAEGDEECTSCGHLYIYELEVRCPDCEVPMCLHCRRRHSDGRLTCVSCIETKPGASTDG